MRGVWTHQITMTCLRGVDRTGTNTVHHAAAREEIPKGGRPRSRASRSDQGRRNWCASGRRIKFGVEGSGGRRCWRNQSGGRWCLKAPVSGLRKNPVTPFSNEVSGRSKNSESSTSSRLAMPLEIDSPELPPCRQPSSRKFRLRLCERRLSRNSLEPKSCDAQRAV